MVPTLFGRLQTRLVLLAVVGGLITAGLAPVLPVAAPMAPDKSEKPEKAEKAGR